MGMDAVAVGVWQKVAAGRGWGKVGEIQTWSTLSLEPRFNRPGLWSLTLPWGTQAVQLSKRHLLTFDFRGTRMTGVIERYGAAADENGQPLLEVSGTDALTLLSDAVGWPSPTKPLDGQTEVRYYRVGPAETVISDFVAANLVARLGYELTVAPSLGRGAEVTVNSPFDNLLAVATDKATLGGIGVRCGLVDGGSSTKATLTFECYQPRDVSARVWLSHRVGTLRTWRQTDTVPGATRAIIEAATEQTGHQIASVSTTANTLTTTSAKTNKLRTGDIVTFTGGTPPAPLELDVAYHAIRVDANTFGVAWTRTDAAEGIAIDLTSSGVGTITVTEQTRRYRQVSDIDAEAEWGRVREVLVTASGEDRNKALDEQGQQALDDQAAQTVFELETTEAAAMRYGIHYAVGDEVLVELVTGVSRTERVGAVRVTATPDSGVVVQTVPGDPDAANPLFALAALVRGLRRRVNQAQED